jgi:(p)ppGpp synthase/HD superfamily hydrolase
MSAGSPHPELRAALMSSVAEKAPRVDRDRLGACFVFAAHAHGEQRRDSGQPFLTHVVEVCRILLDLLESRSTPRSRARRCCTTWSRTRT